MINPLVSVYLAEMERRLTAPKSRRTVSDRELIGFTVLISLLVAPAVAALSWVVYIPGLS